MHSHFLESVESLLNTLVEGVVISGRDHKIQLMNSAAEKMLGCDKRYVTGLEWRDLLTEASIPFVDQEAKSLLHLVKGSKGSSEPCDIQVQLGRTVCDLQLDGLPLYTDGRMMPTGIMWRVNSRFSYGLSDGLSNESSDGSADVFSDSSSGKAADQQVATNSVVSRPDPKTDETVFHIAFNHSPIAQCILDIASLNDYLDQSKVLCESDLEERRATDNNYLDHARQHLHVMAVNQSLVRLMVARDEDHFKQRYGRQISDEFIVQLLRLLLALKRGERSFEFQTEIITFDDMHKLVKIKASLPALEQLTDGLLLNFVGEYQITSAANGYLLDDYAWYKLLERIPYYVNIFEIKTQKRLYENAPLGFYLGYSEEEIKAASADHWYQILHPAERESLDIFKEMYDKLQAGQAFENILRFLHKDGDWHFVQFKTRVLECDNQGMPITGVGIAQDVTNEMQAQRKLAGQEQRYRLLATNMTDIVWTSDENLNINYVTPSVEQVLGYSVNEVLNVGDQRIFHNEQLKDLEQFLKSQLLALNIKAKKGCSPEEIKDFQHVRVVPVKHQSGKQIWLEVKASPLMTEDGRVRGMLCISRDITARKKSDDELKLAAKVFQNGLAATVITDPIGIAVQINRAYSRITGYTPEEVLHRQPKILTETSGQALLYKEISDKVTKTGYWEGEIVHRRKSGEQYPSWMAITEVKDDQGEVVGYITTFTDITERKISEERIHKLAYFDLLTGLPNRSLFGDRLDQALQHAIRTKEYVALLFLDLDRFKAINDTMGHSVGDQLLRSAAHRLLDSVRRDDTVARMGGDEFTIILGALPSKHKAVNAAAHVAHKVMQALSRAFVLEGKETFVGTSIGISFYPIDAEEPAALVQKADTAMYHAKAMGKNNYQFYAEAMTETALARLDIESCLHQALENDEFYIVYQPIITTEEQQTVGVEALLRWNCRGERLVPPVEFIPVAEEAGLIIDIGAWVLEKACYQVAEWESQGFAVGRVAVNVSPKQFANAIIIEQVKRALRISGIKPAQIELEVTEGILMSDLEQTLDTMQRLQKMGVRLSIDDFGTGYSSLSYLRQFPINNLKIDRSFVHGVPGHAQDESLIEAIVAMAHALHLHVIAEGVEGAEQFEFVKGLGCEEVQGYFLGRPQGAEEVTHHFKVVKKYGQKRRNRNN